ncbi:MAG: hypothetical protein JWR02_206 [Mucilaginibacter sp.]|nr:hypothetical protein [Mucilaginibacter sp.]
MNTKIRLVYLFIGLVGLVFATNYIITTSNPSGILFVTAPVMILFFLTRKPYPAENEEKKIRAFDRAYTEE